MTRWLAILLLLVAGALVYMVIQQRSASRPAAPIAEPRAIAPRGDLAADEQSTIELFRSVSPSVVHVTNVGLQRSRLSLNVSEIPQGVGSGFIWDNQGHVVTNYHVIQNAQLAKVMLNDHTVYNGEIIGVAPDKDIAVLKISAPPEALKPLPVGASSNLQVGQKAFAIGNPFGLDQTLTTGVISGLGREVRSVTDRRPLYDLIQTDAPINPGNSGGPLLDSAGRLIGVNTAIYSPSGANAGIGFAVPVDAVNSIVPQLIRYGRVVRPGLGINIGSDQFAAQLNLEGVIIMEVLEGTAAAKAGLRGLSADPNGSWILGDTIVAIDDLPVRKTTDMFRVLDQHKVSDTVKITVVRDSKRRDVEVTLQALP